MEGLMNQQATSVRNHCLSPVRARVAIDGTLGSASYARMFPELPSFHADEQFLLALGRAGGLILDPFMIHEAFPSLTETASGSHPCCVVSVSYFHGGNTGSNPVGDATLEPTTSNGLLKPIGTKKQPFSEQFAPPILAAPFLTRLSLL